jgi:hypothetical protein
MTSSRNADAHYHNLSARAVYNAIKAAEEHYRRVRGHVAEAGQEEIAIACAILHQHLKEADRFTLACSLRTRPD